MTWQDFSTSNCSVQRTLDIIGEKWTILVLRDAMNGIRRFDDLHRHVGLSEATLSDRLRKLVTAGILETWEYQEAGQRMRLEYRLTDKGWDLRPAMIALMQWGDEYLADPSGAAMVVDHSGCGEPVRAELRCGRGHKIRAVRELAATPGPGAVRKEPQRAS